MELDLMTLKEVEYQLNELMSEEELSDGETLDLVVEMIKEMRKEAV